MDDRDLAPYRAAYRYSLAQSAEPPPTDEELAALVAGELDGEERDRVVLQMLKSPEAMEKHRILEELHRQATERGSAQRRWLQGAGIAAALVLAVSVWALAPRLMTPPDERVVRSQDTNVSPPNGAEIAKPPEILRWPSQAGASSYRVKVRDAAANVIWSAESGDASQIEVPQDLSDRLSAGGTFLWTVEATFGGSVDELGPYSFEIVKANGR